MAFVPVDNFLRIGKETLKQEVSTRFHNEITEDEIEKWGEILDLFRIPKITPRVAEWLVNADINSVEELSHRDAMDIFYKLKTLDEKTYFIILNLPTLGEIDEWINFAKLMVLADKIWVRYSANYIFSTCDRGFCYRVPDVSCLDG